MMKNSKALRRLIGILFLVIAVCVTAFAASSSVKATDINIGGDDDSIITITDTSDEDSDDSDRLTIGISAGDGSDLASVLQILLVLTVIALAPSILVMLTSFTRIIIVLHFTRAALNTQSSPPNQVLIGLALFLTFFTMAPTFKQVYDEAIIPLSNNEITAEEAFDVGIAPVREFMLKQTNTKDIKLFIEVAQLDTTEMDDYDDIPLHVLIPAFIVSELRIAFIIGFLIYIPFIIIDMVVASVLMSMGMMMLPPTTISMPFKILLFVLADGWSLIIGNLVQTFNY